MTAEHLIFVYKSQHKSGRYLYLKEKDVFACVPQGLLDAFGVPVFVMMFASSRHQSLPHVNKDELMEALRTKGYYLRIDLEPLEENLINVERRFRGLEPLSKEELAELFK